MFKGDFTDICAERFVLVSMGRQVCGERGPSLVRAEILVMVVHINILVHVLGPTGPDGGHEDHDQDSLDCPHGPLTVFGLWLVCSTEVLIVSYQSKYSNYLVSCPQWVSLQKYFRCL